MSNSIAEAANIVLQNQNTEKNSSYDITATVTKVEEDTIWVHIDGGVDETPCLRTVKCSVGEQVRVRIANGTAWVLGNSSSPSTDDTMANTANKHATNAAFAASTAKTLATKANTYANEAFAAATRAEADASRAYNAANNAETYAQNAADSASNAESSASEAATQATNAATSSAQAATEAAAASESARLSNLSAENAQGDATRAANNASNAASSAATASLNASNAAQSASQAHYEATNATKYATSVLDQVSLVEDVMGVLSWATEHGTFVATTDTTIIDGKVYFTYDSDTGDYSPVVMPVEEDIDEYYELTVNEAMDSFIMAHLAVTSRGLWVLPNGKGSSVSEQSAPGYKMLLAQSGMYLYDDSGVLVSTFGESIIFNSTRSQVIGGENNYILFDPSDGSLTITGDLVRIGNTGKTLSEVLTGSDVTFVYNTASGHMASVEDAYKYYLRSCIADINFYQTGSGTPSASNVRPIQGRSTVTITCCGKNILQYPYDSSSSTVSNIPWTINSDGTISINGTHSTGNNASNFVLMSGNYYPYGKYYFSGCQPQGASDTYGIYCSSSANQYDSAYDVGSGNNFNHRPNANDIPSSYGIYTRCYVGKNKEVSDLLFKPMLSVTPVTYDDYEPYKGSKITIQLERTVYGGYINATSGALTVTHGYISSYSGEAINEPWVSSMDEYEEGTTPTVGAQVVYPLDEPLSYQLAPAAIMTEMGINNIWADSGDISIEYVQSNDFMSTSSIIADQARIEAEENSALDATNKMNSAITTAAADATTKANNAAKTATSYMTDITDNGIFVHERSDTPMNPTDSNANGVHITDVVDIIRDGNVMSSFGENVTIGNTSYAFIDFHSLRMIDRNEHEFLHVSDLRDSYGYVDMTEIFYANGNDDNVRLHFYVTNLLSVTKNGIELTRGTDYTLNGLDVVFTTTPSRNDEIEVTYTTNSALYAFTFGYRESNPTIGRFSVSEGYINEASGAYSYSQGFRCVARGEASHAEGYYNTALAAYSHVEGYRNEVSGNYSHAEGYDNSITPDTTQGHFSRLSEASHVEGWNNTIFGASFSHAEGYQNTASGAYSHVEGQGNTSSYECAHAEGQNTTSSGTASHSEGLNTTASGDESHSEGLDATASGRASHAQNLGTIANVEAQTAIGKYNDTGNYSFIIGNGVKNGDVITRKNALTIDWDGHIYARQGSICFGYPTAYALNNAGIAIGSSDPNSPTDVFTVNESTGDVTAKGEIRDGSNNVLSNKADASDLPAMSSPTPTISRRAVNNIYRGYIVPNSIQCRKYGKIVYLSFTVYNNSEVTTSSTNNGRDIFLGKIDDQDLRPAGGSATGSSYWGTHSIGGLITTTGNITIRNASSSSFTPSYDPNTTPVTNNSIAMSFIYMVD